MCRGSDRARIGDAIEQQPAQSSTTVTDDESTDRAIEIEASVATTDALLEGGLLVTVGVNCSCFGLRGGLGLSSDSAALVDVLGLAVCCSPKEPSYANCPAR